MAKAHRLVHLDPLPPDDLTFGEHRRVLQTYFSTRRIGGVKIRFDAPVSADPSELMHLAVQAHYWLVTNTLVNRGLIEASPRLRYIHKIGVLGDSLDMAAAREHGIVVSVSPHAGRVAVAEHTLLLMLAVGKDLIGLHSRASVGGNPQGLTPRLTSQDESYFNFLGLPGERFTQLHTRTLGIIGLGEIGRMVAVRARVFGMRVLYVNRRRLAPEQEVSLGVTYASLETLLRQSDFVSIHAVQTSETTRLIGRAELRLMRPTAYLVNTARGNIIDEAALVEALRTGQIAGAGLDVFSIEPLQADNPLLELPNVVLTPHVAFRGPVIDWYRPFIANLDALLSGRRPESTV